ncbi:hypothetical protein EV213_10919 [Aureibacillus halotolerans]|uniref:Uncharacterized protein n=1 Tax=Aureibacillus halotolerans TaxID=1508390 RepID=A0A4R6U0D3_9BACI|nr:hypothetical protein EV213_10919 [Aureibacillus halotolerans]
MKEEKLGKCGLKLNRPFSGLVVGWNGGIQILMKS